MQIVIDIPEMVYYFIKTHFRYENPVDMGILNGIVLPKGHGRLIDADNIIQTIDKEYPNLDRQDIKQWIKNALTVLDADKEI